MDYFSENLDDKDIRDLIHRSSHDINTGLEPLMDRIGDARIVLLGEASHGTHEYYIWRSRITQQLIRDKGFNLIAVEGDWPDCYRINRYIRHYENGGSTAFEVLKNFHRWPTWMWANWETDALMEWLRKHNQGKEHAHQTGFYGLDVYSLWESLEAIIDYLKKHDPDSLDAAYEAFNCFEPYSREGIDYASSVRFIPESCEKPVVELLQQLQQDAAAYDGDPEASFSARQNAQIAVNAEKYYRSMIGGGPDSWNIRDRHMTQTLENLLDFHGRNSKVIVWEHNTHIGDARATDMRDDNMVNVGQLVREKWGPSDTVLVGFGSYQGSVIASHSWGAPMRKMQVPAARHDSWEALLHRTDPSERLIIARDIKNIPLMDQPINHRAIGVVYHPDRDHYGNYVPSIIPGRYDAFIYIDNTQALHPIRSDTERHMTPATYPWAE
ncbi:MAG: erythromycin esterase family protein [Bacteroidales bacterium]